MKNFESIVKEIKRNADRIAAAKKEHDTAYAEWRNLFESTGRFAANRSQEETEKLEAVESVMISTDQKVNDLKLASRFLANNAKLAVFHSNAAAVAEVWNRYAGKQYGAKTAEKIKSEIKEKTGCNFWVDSGYGSNNGFTLTPDGYYNTYSVTAHSIYNEGKPVSNLLIDNKIQAIDTNNFKVSYIKREYIENIPAAVRKVKKLYEAAVKAQKELEAACSEYNALAVNGMPTANSRETLYSNLLAK